MVPSILITELYNWKMNLDAADQGQDPPESSCKEAWKLKPHHGTWLNDCQVMSILKGIINISMSYFVCGMYIVLNLYFKKANFR